MWHRHILINGCCWLLTAYVVLLIVLFSILNIWGFVLSYWNGKRGSGDDRSRGLGDILCVIEIVRISWYAIISYFKWFFLYVLYLLVSTKRVKNYLIVHNCTIMIDKPAITTGFLFRYCPLSVNWFYWF